MSDSRRIAELADRLGRITHGLQYAEGLNPAQWEALRFIARANRNSCSPGALADFLGITKGTTSQTLIALESKGFISRCRSVTDRRSVDICITDLGRDLMGRDPLCRVREASNGLSEEEGSTLATAMERLIRGLQRAQGLPEFGACVTCEHFCSDCDDTDVELKCRCALSGELLDCDEQVKICVNFNAAG